MNYVTKSITVDAVKITKGWLTSNALQVGRSVLDIGQVMARMPQKLLDRGAKQMYVCKTTKGYESLTVGDWLVTFPDGDVVLMRDAEFSKIYQRELNVKR